jgi:LCP family protein required for cell wall assembly
VSRNRNEHDDRGGSGLPARLDPRAGRPGSRRPSGDAEPGRPGILGRLGTFGAVRVLAGVLSLLLLTTTGWGWYLARVADAAVTRTNAIPGSGNNGGGQEAMNLLLVGSDSRTSLTPEQERELHTGGNSGRNTDTMILVHLPADGSKASFVSFPRDSYVDIPGHGKDKLNAAYAYGYQGVSRSAPESERQAGGAQLLVKTISALTGLEIDHYAEVDLLGFFNLSSVVGGVEVNLCKAVNDRRYSGAVLPAGVQTISGADAVKFVRQRHGLPRGDFDRIIRQQVFMAGVLRKMLSEQVLLNPVKQREFVQAAAGSVTVDQNLDLFQLGQQMQSVTAGQIKFQTIPYIGDGRDDKNRYILKLEDPAILHDFFEHLSADPQSRPKPSTASEPKVSPADVAVEVYNGTGTSGLASSTAAALQTAGFAVGATGNAESTNSTRTEIRYAPGDKARATALEAQIHGAVLTERAELSSGTVQLMLGSDFTQVGQAVTPSVAAKPSPAAPAAEGKDARTAADTSCIN